jgi:HEAT repeat protein
MSDFDFQPYRDFILLDGDKRRALYTPTDALLPLQVGMVAQREQGDQTDSSQERVVEQLPVLEGLRKYALGDQREHVILAGRPGSGKSTALQQLRLALAAEGLVPVLVQLKGDRSVPEMIQEEFRRAKQKVSLDQIDDWLLADRLVLLLDGVNEIPTDDLRRGLAEFRDQNATVPMIFTTRDLAVGGDLGIKQRLEMKPLTELQMRKFVGKRLPVDGEKLLGQLGDRLREIAETPLLLRMLCDVFGQTGQIPENKGELFRLFDQEYDKFKGFPPVSEDYRRFKSEILQHLAFVMMTGDSSKPTEFWLTINKGVAEREIEKLLVDRVNEPAAKAKEWLEDLLEHHLLQVAADTSQTEFHHQLFQEYYAAEKLLRMFNDGHLDVIDEQRFQHFYLNYLKWTEVILIGLSLLKDIRIVASVVQQSINLDLMLGSILARQTSAELQNDTVQLLKGLKKWLLIKSLGKIGSEINVPELLQALDDLDWQIAEEAAGSLGRIGSPAAILGLTKANCSRSSVAKTKALGRIGSEEAIPGLIKAFHDSNEHVSRSAIEALIRINSKSIRPELIEALCSSDWRVQYRATEILKEIGSKEDIPRLRQVLNSSDSYTRCRVIDVLGAIGGDESIYLLQRSCNNSNSNVRKSAAAALRKIFPNEISKKSVDFNNNPDSAFFFKGSFEYLRTKIYAVFPQSLIQQSIDVLLVMNDLEVPLRNLGWNERNRVSKILINIDSKKTASGISQSFKDSNWYVRCYAVKALGRINNKEVIPALLLVFNDLDWRVRKRTSTVLGEIGFKESIPGLIQALQDINWNVRVEAAKALGKIRSRKAVPGLVQALNDPDRSVRRFVAESLGKIGSEEAIPNLLQSINSLDENAWESIADALGEIGSDKAIPGLVELLNNSNPDLRIRAAHALSKIGSELAVYILANAEEWGSAIEACEWGRRRKRDGAEIFIPFLKKILDSQNSDLRKMATAELRENGAKAAIPGLLQSLEDSNSDVRREAIYAFSLDGIGSEESVPGLCQALNDSDSLVAWRAADALGWIRSETAIPDLLKAMNNSNWQVRMEAATALGRIGSEIAVPGLIESLSSPDESVRKSVANALGMIDSELATIGLLLALSDKKSAVRENAANALGKSKGNSVIHLLPDLQKLLSTDSVKEAYHVIEIIQANCGFYNYDIFCSPPTQTTIHPPGTTTTINANEVRIFENVQEYYEHPPDST